MGLPLSSNGTSACFALVQCAVLSLYILMLTNVCDLIPCFENYREKSVVDSPKPVEERALVVNVKPFVTNYLSFNDLLSSQSTPLFVLL